MSTIPASVARIYSKTLRCALKRGLGFTKICQKYGCTEDELRDRIRRLYHEHDGEEVIRQLTKNEIAYQETFFKINASTAKPATESVAEPTEPTVESVAEPITEPTELISGSVIDPVTEPATLPEPETITPPQFSPKVSLTTQRDELQKRLKETSETIQSLQEEQDASLKAMELLQVGLEHLMLDFNFKYNEWETEKAARNRRSQEIELLEQQQSVERSNLQEIERQIQLISKISLLVYDNGDIELVEKDTANDAILDDTGYEELCDALLRHKSVENLRIKDIRTLARILLIDCRMDFRLEPTFENSELEPVYEALRKEFA